MRTKNVSRRKHGDGMALYLVGKGKRRECVEIERDTLTMCKSALCCYVISERMMMLMGIGL